MKEHNPQHPVIIPPTSRGSSNARAGISLTPSLKPPTEAPDVTSSAKTSMDEQPAALTAQPEPAITQFDGAAALASPYEYAPMPETPYVPPAPVPDVERWVVGAWSISNFSHPAAINATLLHQIDDIITNFTKMAPEQVQVQAMANVTLGYRFRGFAWSDSAARALRSASSAMAGGFAPSHIDILATEPPLGGVGTPVDIHNVSEAHGPQSFAEVLRDAPAIGRRLLMMMISGSDDGSDHHHHQQQQQLLTVHQPSGQQQQQQQQQEVEEDGVGPADYTSFSRSSSSSSSRGSTSSLPRRLLQDGNAAAAAAGGGASEAYVVYHHFSPSNVSRLITTLNRVCGGNLTEGKDVAGGLCGDMMLEGLAKEGVAYNEGEYEQVVIEAPMVSH